MTLKILEVEADLLPQYATIPIAFRVESIFQVELVGLGLGGIQLREAKVSPYIKDYDALPDGGPLEWPKQFDIRNWGFLMAEEAGNYVGGAVVAFNTNGVNMLERRSDLAVLWDIRVRPERRGRGIGKALFHALADWACPRGCRQLKVETQNVNVAACRFHQPGLRTRRHPPLRLRRSSAGRARSHAFVVSYFMMLYHLGMI